LKPGTGNGSLDHYATKLSRHVIHVPVGRLGFGVESGQNQSTALLKLKIGKVLTHFGGGHGVTALPCFPVTSSMCQLEVWGLELKVVKIRSTALLKLKIGKVLTHFGGGHGVTALP